MFCQQCGHEVNTSSRFCSACGAPVAPMAQEPTEPSSVYYTPETLTPPPPRESSAWWWLGFVEPVIGFLLFLGLKTRLPEVSKKVGKGALVGAIVAVVLYLFVTLLGGFLGIMASSWEDDPFGSEFPSWYGDYYDM